MALTLHRTRRVTLVEERRQVKRRRGADVLSVVLSVLIAPAALVTLVAWRRAADRD